MPCRLGEEGEPDPEGAQGKRWKILKKLVERENAEGNDPWTRPRGLLTPLCNAIHYIFFASGLILNFFFNN